MPRAIIIENIAAPISMTNALLPVLPLREKNAKGAVLAVQGGLTCDRSSG